MLDSMYKLVAVDLDGTMLNSYGEVSENTKRVVKETMQKDVTSKDLNNKVIKVRRQQSILPR